MMEREALEWAVGTADAVGVEIAVLWNPMIGYTFRQLTSINAGDKPEAIAHPDGTVVMNPRRVRQELAS